MPELLENILVHLPMLDILTAQRVSTTFRDIVNESTRIKRKLFFIADAPEETWVCSGASHEDIDFVREKFRDPARVNDSPTMRSSQNPDYRIIPIEVNPLFKVKNSPARLREPANSKLSAKFLRHRCQLTLRHTIRTLDREASWRRMYLSDPPFKEPHIRLTFETKRSPVHSLQASCEFNSGKVMTFGAAVDSLIERGSKVSHNGKKCSHWEPGNVGKAFFQLQWEDGREPYIPRDGDGDGCTAYGYVVPTEEQWALEK